MRASLVAFGLLWFGSAWGSPAVGGGSVFRVPDTGMVETCIDGSNSEVTLFIQQVVVDSKADLFHDNADAGLLTTVVFTGRDDQGDREVKYPVSRWLNVREARGEQIKLPARYPLLSRFKLSNGKSEYSDVTVNLRFLSEQQNSVFARVLNKTTEFVNNSPFKANPFVAAFDTVARYSTGIVDEIQRGRKAPDGTFDAIAGFAFSRSSTCQSTFATTGSYLYVAQAQGPTNKGYVNAATANRYCWKVLREPAVEVYWLDRNADSSCPAITATSGKMLANPHVLFSLDALSLVAASAPKAPKTRELIVPAMNIAYTASTSSRPVDADFKNVFGTMSDSGREESTKRTVRLLQSGGMLDTARASGNVRFLETTAFTAVGYSINGDQAKFTLMPSDEALELDIARTLTRCDFYGVAATDCL